MQKAKGERWKLGADGQAEDRFHPWLQRHRSGWDLWPETGCAGATANLRNEPK